MALVGKTWSTRTASGNCYFWEVLEEKFLTELKKTNERRFTNMRKCNEYNVTDTERNDFHCDISHQAGLNIAQVESYILVG